MAKILNYSQIEKAKVLLKNDLAVNDLAVLMNCGYNNALKLREKCINYIQNSTGKTVDLKSINGLPVDYVIAALNIDVDAINKKALIQKELER